MPRCAGYLLPYLAAAKVHGDGFASLLWASPATQRARFCAIAEMVNMKGKIVLDVGCGRADLLRYLNERGESPGQYIGIEAVAELASSARSVVRDDDVILDVDFVKHPPRMMVGAHVVCISGAINTLDKSMAMHVLDHAWHATAESLVFNFLASPDIAQADYLYWHQAQHMLDWARQRDPRAVLRTDYLEGDATIAMVRS
jgi:SAM-dependent methyltransferase